MRVGYQRLQTSFHSPGATSLVLLGHFNNHYPLLSFVFSIHCFICVTFKSATTSSIHLRPCLPLHHFSANLLHLPCYQHCPNFPSCLCQIRLPESFRKYLFLILPGLIVGFRNKLLLRCGVVGLTPNTQPGGPGYSFSSGSSPLNSLAWAALPVAYATASITLGFIGPRKPLHYVKVAIKMLQTHT